MALIIFVVGLIMTFSVVCLVLGDARLVPGASWRFNRDGLKYVFSSKFIAVLKVLIVDVLGQRRSIVIPKRWFTMPCLLILLFFVACGG
jgi:hypothetical protein